MSDQVPILLMAFARPDLLRLCMEQLSKTKPPVLYIMGDGPRNEGEKKLCRKSREIAENPNWKCEIIKIYKEENQGIVKSFIEGMSRMFEDFEFGIYLEDDIIISENFYPFCQELLLKYKNHNSIGHINATNVCPKFKPVNNESYIFGNYITEWGFATWKRVWDLYDVNMISWKTTNKTQILKENTFNLRSRNSLKKMFDLHCENSAPLAWGYQWHFNCLKNNLMAITPVSNMSLNLGFERNDSTNTFGKNPIASDFGKCSFPLIHPCKTERNIMFDKCIEDILCPSHIKILTGKLFNFLRKIKS